MTLTNSFIQIGTKISANEVFNQVLEGLKKSFCKSDIERLAYETGFIERSSSKITGSDFLISCLVESCGGKRSTLEKMSETVTRVNHRIKISAQALMKRLNDYASAAFFKVVYSRILKQKLMQLEDVPSALLARFSKVLLQDSSSIILNEELQEHFRGSGGRASKAAAKFDVIYDWKAKNYEQITLTDQGEADQTLGLEIETFLTEGSLVIRDLGYLCVDSLIKIIAKRAFFLSRLKSNMKVYLKRDDEEPVDIAEYIAKTYENVRQLDLQVFITNKRLPVRLVVYKAPEDVVNKRRREAKATAKKQGRQLREKTLMFMNYTMFITNVPLEIWEPGVVGTIYRIRWQIELIFKCWKSKTEIHYLKGINPERIKCLIYAKLILILLIDLLHNPAE